ncbi:MAG: S8 family serine peptidase [Limisphaerales bacterium]
MADCRFRLSAPAIHSRLFGLALALGLLASITVHAETKSVRLRNQIIVTHPKVQPAAVQTQALDQPVSGLYLLQFEDRLQPAGRDALQQRGVRLLRYVPDDTFVARLDGVRLNQIRALPFVRWLGPYEAKYKIHAGLQNAVAKAPPTTATAVRLLLAPDAAPLDIFRVRRTLQSVRGESRSRFGVILHGRATAGQLATLAESPQVLWIEPVPKFKLLDEVSAKLVGGGEVGGTNVHATITQQLGFDGRGVVVAVADTGLNNGDAATMHPDLAGRVDAFVWYPPLTDAADGFGHGTHVAGIVAGNGATGETDDNGALYGLGVAPGAHLVVQRIFDDTGNDDSPPHDTLTRDAIRVGAVIGSNSWGNDVQGRYDLDAAEFDALVRDADPAVPGDQPYLLEFSAGNAGPGAQTIDSPAVAKNVIATGASENDRQDLFIYADGPDAMADFSSRGPCEDGRIKPDLVAPGTWIASLQSASATADNSWSPIDDRYQYEGGTSQAGPHASGAAAVFVQYYRETHGKTTPSPALVKAALINSAVPLGDPGLGAAPNFDEGWGRVDLTQIIGSPRRCLFVDQTNLLATGQTYEQSVVVGSSDQPLRITLAYSDVPGLPAAIPALVNDLDLEVIGPDGSLYRGNQFDATGESAPNASTGDNINNVEGIQLSQPIPGQYVVRVRARNVAEDVFQRTNTTPQQDFALVISGDLPLPGVGVVVLDRLAYTVPDRIQIKLIDFDLTNQPSAAVGITSTTQTNGLTLTLSAFGTFGVFTGSVATAAGPAVADGRLHVSDGDTIEATYQDLVPVTTRTATAVADLVPPGLTAVTETNHFGRAYVAWQTDEPATAIVRYGTNQNLSFAVTNSALLETHELALTGLVAGVTYQFEAISADQAGNTSTNDNAGRLYTFVPTPAAAVLLVDAYVPVDPSVASTTDVPLTAYTDALDQSGVSYEVWDVSHRGSPGTNDLAPFRVLIWRINDNPLASVPGATDNTLTAPQQAAIQAYLNRGGSFFLSSMEILSRLGDVPFRTNVLQMLSVNEDAGVPSIIGVTNDPISSGMAMDLDYSTYDSDFLQLLEQSPDVGDTFTPTTNAVPIFFDGASNKVCGIRFPRTSQNSQGRVVFLSFPLDTAPPTGTSPNTRADLLRNSLNFLAPGADGLATLAFDSATYTIPSRVTVELGDSNLAGQGQETVLLFSNSATNGQAITLDETLTPGLFRGFVTLVAAANMPASGQPSAGNALPARNGDSIWVEFFSTSSNLLARAAATVDTVPPAIANVVAIPDYEAAAVSWDTSKPTDALVQFGESTFLGRTAYEFEMAASHSVAVPGLQPDHLYYYQVVSRDAAGNTTVDDNQGKLYTVRTLRPLSVPWTDDLEHGSTNWTVQNGDTTGVTSAATWQLGVPHNGLETVAHSPTHAWGSNLNGTSIDAADTALISPPIYLTGGNQATLRFWQSYDFTTRSDQIIVEDGQLFVSADAGHSWVQLAQYTDATAGWEEAAFDLTPFLGHVVYLEWHYEFFAIDTEARPGWLIDDLSVTVTNAALGTIQITNNLAQARFTLNGPLSQAGKGWSLTLSNAPAGQYILTFGDVPYYQTPPPQTNDLTASNILVFRGNYTFTDANQNGIPDPWEQQFFGDVSSSRTVTTDTDGDGMSDYAEFVAGTNPNNVLSFLHLDVPQQLPNGTLRLAWSSVSGRAYRLGGSTNLAAWSPYSDWLLATTNKASFTLPPLNGSISYFFRLEVRP